MLQLPIWHIHKLKYPYDAFLHLGTYLCLRICTCLVTWVQFLGIYIFLCKHSTSFSILITWVSSDPLFSKKCNTVVPKTQYNNYKNMHPLWTTFRGEPLELNQSNGCKIDLPYWFQTWLNSFWKMSHRAWSSALNIGQ